MVQKLYENLTTTADTKNLLDLFKPIFNFVHESQFKLQLWPKKLLDAVEVWQWNKTNLS